MNDGYRRRMMEEQEERIRERYEEEYRSKWSAEREKKDVDLEEETNRITQLENVISEIMAEREKERGTEKIEREKIQKELNYLREEIKEERETEKKKRENMLKELEDMKEERKKEEIKDKEKGRKIKEERDNEKRERDKLVKELEDIRKRSKEKEVERNQVNDNEPKERRWWRGVKDLDGEKKAEDEEIKQEDTEPWNRYYTPSERRQLNSWKTAKIGRLHKK